MGAFAERYEQYLNDQRRARWAVKYYSGGHHRRDVVADCPQPETPLRQAGTLTASSNKGAAAPATESQHAKR